MVGDSGYNVVELQTCLGLAPDGDFGKIADGAVQTYQMRKHLSVDGAVGPMTWAALEADFQLPAYPPPLPPSFADDERDEIIALATSSSLFRIRWGNRGMAPSGYTKGMALAYGQAVVRFNANDPLVREVAKASTGHEGYDALAWYEPQFANRKMSVNVAGLANLRHTYVLLMGLGMRESDGMHCCGRDQSAHNVTANTCETGLFQQSWNFSTCCTDIVNLFDSYEKAAASRYLPIFSEHVSCGAKDWENYGTGLGMRFQKLCKRDPLCAIETAAVGVRNIRRHWGPINRKEVEIRPEADALFKEIEAVIGGAAVA
jgi:hypothetical protein